MVEPFHVPLATVPRFDVVAVKVVNVPVEGVVAPIAVELIPVAVVVKLPEVKLMLFEPALMDDAESPERDRAPDVAVRFSAPVVCVKPFEAVSVDAEVIVPEPLVEILPDAVMLPVTSTQ